MPSIKDKSTVEHLVRSFFTNGRCVEQAMIQTGYSKTYARSYCGQVWAKPQIKAEIVRYEAETKANVAIELRWEREDNLQYQYKQLRRYEAILDGDPSRGIEPNPNSDYALRGIDRVLHELNASSGQHSSTVNTGDTKAKHYTQAELERAAEFAKGLPTKMITSTDSLSQATQSRSEQ